jgi:hypothetical protein
MDDANRGIFSMKAFFPVSGRLSKKRIAGVLLESLLTVPTLQKSHGATAPRADHLPGRIDILCPQGNAKEPVSGVATSWCFGPYWHLHQMKNRNV